MLKKLVSIDKDRLFYKIFFTEKLVKKQMLLYLEGIGDWVKFPDTIHEGLTQLPEALS